MNNENTSTIIELAKPSSTPKRRKSQSPKTPADTPKDIIVESDVIVESSKPTIPKQVDPTQIITVRNGFQGRLVYKSKRSGERFVWDEFGSEQDMEIGELKNARNSNKKYFINNWFMFDEDWVVDYLGLKQYYKFAISISDFDKFFSKDAEDVETNIKLLSAGQKKSIAYRARQLIAEGQIDSNKTISVLEKALDTELIER